MTATTDNRHRERATEVHMIQDLERLKELSEKVERAVGLAAVVSSYRRFNDACEAFVRSLLSGDYRVVPVEPTEDAERRKFRLRPGPHGCFRSRSRSHAGCCW